jgi:hypothetical protein
MLPYSRNETHDTSTSIKPSTIDDMQDCIIGMKHGAIRIPIAAAAFQASSLDGTGFVVGAGEWQWTTDGRYVHAALSWPAGTKIVGIDWNIDKAGHSAAFFCELRAAKLGVIDFPAGFASDDGSSAFGYHTFAQVFERTMLGDGTMYQLRAGYLGGAGSVGATKFEGCMVYVVRP